MSRFYRHPLPPIGIATASIGMLAVASAFVAQADELRDPTRPPDAIEGEELTPERTGDAPWILSAILVAQGRRIAVVNGQPVQAGERVASAVVQSILRDEVILRVQDRDVRLRLVPTSFKHHEESRP